MKKKGRQVIKILIFSKFSFNWKGSVKLNLPDCSISDWYADAGPDVLRYKEPVSQPAAEAAFTFLFIFLFLLLLQQEQETAGVFHQKSQWGKGVGVGLYGILYLLYYFFRTCHILCIKCHCSVKNESKGMSWGAHFYVRPNLMMPTDNDAKESNLRITRTMLYQLSYDSGRSLSNLLGISAHVILTVLWVWDPPMAKVFLCPP